MSIKVQDWVADRQFNNSTDKNVLMAMASHASDCGHGVWASHQSLADRSGVSRETAGRSIKRLLKVGLVEITGKRVKGSVWTHEYRVVLEALYDMPMTATAQAVLDRFKTKEVTERHNGEVTQTRRGSDGASQQEVTERHTNRPEPSLNRPSAREADNGDDVENTQSPDKPKPDKMESRDGQGISECEKPKGRGLGWWGPYADAIKQAAGSASVLSGLGDPKQIAGWSKRLDVPMDRIAGGLLAFYRDPATQSYSTPISVSSALSREKFVAFLDNPADPTPPSTPVADDIDAQEARMAQYRKHAA